MYDLMGLPYFIMGAVIALWSAAKAGWIDRPGDLHQNMIRSGHQTRCCIGLLIMAAGSLMLFLGGE